MHKNALTLTTCDVNVVIMLRAVVMQSQLKNLTLEGSWQRDMAGKNNETKTDVQLACLFESKAVGYIDVPL